MGVVDAICLEKVVVGRWSCCLVIEAQAAKEVHERQL